MKPKIFMQTTKIQNLIRLMNVIFFTSSVEKINFKGATNIQMQIKYLLENSVIVNDKYQIKDYLVNVNQKWCKGQLKDYGIDFEKNKLYIFAFDCAQGNFIVLRIKKLVAFIDGGNHSKIKGGAKTKLKEILQDATIKYVFLSHSDHDHCSIFTVKTNRTIPNLAQILKDSHTVFVLGGRKEDWLGKNGQNIVVFDCQMIYPQSDLIENSTFQMDDVSFKILNAKLKIKKNAVLQQDQKHTIEMTTGDLNNQTEDTNTNSLIIVASIHKKNILFAGDADSDTLSLLIQKSNNVFQLLNIIKACNSEHSFDDNKRVESIQERIAEGLDLKQSALVIYKAIESDYSILKERHNILQAISSDTIQEWLDQNSKISKMKEIFKSIDMIIVPHHGSSTNGSNRWITVIESQKSVCLISSCPLGQHRLPRNITIELLKEKLQNFETFEHQILFSYNDDEKQIQNKQIKEPIFVTGAAPGGLYCFQVDDNETLQILDVQYSKCNQFPNVRSEFNWYDLTNRKIAQFGLIGNDLLEHYSIDNDSNAHSEAVIQDKILKYDLSQSYITLEIADMNKQEKSVLKLQLNLFKQKELTQQQSQQSQQDKQIIEEQILTVQQPSHPLQINWKKMKQQIPYKRKSNKQLHPNELKKMQKK